MTSLELPPEPTEDYLLWKKDLALWQKLTETPKEKMGIALQYVCRSNYKLHEAIVNIDSNKVEKKGGIDEVINQNTLTINSHEIFEQFKRKENQTVLDFIFEFKSLVSKNEKNGIHITDNLLAYLLLKKANLSQLSERPPLNSS